MRVSLLWATMGNGNPPISMKWDYGSGLTHFGTFQFQHSCWKSTPQTGNHCQSLVGFSKPSTWLSLRNDIPLSKDTNIIREYVKHGVTTLAHFHEKLEDDNEFVFRINRFKPIHKFMTEFNFDPELAEEIRSINKTIQRGIECHSSELLLFPSTQEGKYCKCTPIQAKCIQFQKGCSFITKPLEKTSFWKRNGPMP